MYSPRAKWPTSAPSLVVARDFAQDVLRRPAPQRYLRGAGVCERLRTSASRPAPFLSTPKTLIFTRYFRYCSRRSSGTARPSRTARILNSSPGANRQLTLRREGGYPAEHRFVRCLEWTIRNCPCMGMLWKSFRYGNTKVTWNSIPPSRKPRKIPTTCSLGKSSTFGISLPFSILLCAHVSPS